MRRQLWYSSRWDSLDVLLVPVCRGILLVCILVVCDGIFLRGIPITPIAVFFNVECL